jgi:beta-glucanase (GH16 family)
MRLISLALASSFFVVVSWAAAASGPEWRLIWQDEFNGPRDRPPDATKWTYDIGGGGWGNHELERYTDRIENVSLDGRGHLVIRANRNASGEYASARLKTQGHFQVFYGKVEARIKIPRGPGLWPAFWMLGDDHPRVGWPACGEIDIMENIGKEPAVIHGTLHGPGFSGANGISRKMTLNRGHLFSGRFHTFGIEWSPESIGFFVDRREYARIASRFVPEGGRWVFDHPFFLLLNLAVGGDWPGNPDSSTRFPAVMVVDWVRVWQRVPNKSSSRTPRLHPVLNPRSDALRSQTKGSH